MASFEDGAYASDGYLSWLSMFKRGSTDWTAGTWDWPSEFLYDNWNFPYTCGMCKRGEICAQPLLRCNKCKIAHYCSPDHQAKAWPVHKQACKHFSKFLSNFNEAETISNYHMWKSYLIKGQLAIRALSPVDDPFRHRMNSDEWFSQRHCQVCFYNPAAPGPDRTLKECSLCHCAGYCDTPECKAGFRKQHTAQACEKYMIGLAALVISTQGGGQAVQTTQTREQTLNLPASWSEYFTRKIEDMACPPALLRMAPMMAMVTDSLSLPMTILGSLKLAHGAALSTMRRVEVHVVGNDIPELYLAHLRYHEILHWLPACRELVLYFISPAGNASLPGAMNRVYSNVPESTPCTQCDAVGAKLYLRFVHGLYHDVAAARGTSAHTNASRKLLLDEVSLVIACNAGLHDDIPNPSRPSYASTWRPTLEFLVKADVPCVFTSYNADEIVMDRAVLQSVGGHIVVEPHVNPFRGLRPFPEIGEDNKFYYTNQSCVMMRGSAISSGSTEG